MGHGRAYRPIPGLDVFGDTPSKAFFDRDEDPLEQAIRAVPGTTRPIRATHNGSHFVLRIPGVQVVHQVPVDWWMDDEFCTDTPNVRRVFGDRRTGKVVVEIDYISGARLCDDGVYTRVISVPDAAFDAIDARPTSAVPKVEDLWAATEG